MEKAPHDYGATYFILLGLVPTEVHTSFWC